jgi:ABC-type polysaccharide/polyol phosphate export permease
MRVILELHPRTRIVLLCRDALSALSWPSVSFVLTLVVTCLAVFVLGAFLFQRKARNVIEEL